MINTLFSFDYAFNNFSEFIAMGKHGLYVWLSYGIFLSCIALLFISSCLRSVKIKRNLAGKK